MIALDDVVKGTYEYYVFLVSPDTFCIGVDGVLVWGAGNAQSRLPDHSWKDANCFNKDRICC